MTRPPAAPIPFRRSVRARLLAIALLPLLIVLPLLLAMAARNWSARFDEVLIAKIHGELTIAHQHLAGLLQGQGAGIAALAGSAEFAREVRGTGFAAWLATERTRLGLDFLDLLAPGDAAGTGAGRWPVVQAARAGQQAVAIDIFSAGQLARLDPALAERAHIALVPTRAAVPTQRQLEDRGMVVQAAAPAPGGVLVGGVLLNRNLDFIDAMNDLVYPGGSQGTATLFLDDVRISTNVRLFADVRALGTRVSAAVRARVLDQGEVWLDRAFVVNDWYVSGYEPIIDSFGARVGMLYVGFLDAPYAAAERRSLIRIGLIVLGVVALAVPVLLIWARGIFAPLERMTAVLARVEAGEAGARVAASGGRDEIARVAARLDTLLDQVAEREQRLREHGETLEARVAARTRDLEAANRQLDATTRQLIISEKLAAIGEITAGVAHEINNPLAVIQGNIDVVRDDLGPRAEPLRTEFTLIQQQIQAIHILVTKLLRFARPEEYAETGTGHDPDGVIRDTMPLVRHLLSKAGVALTLDLESAGTVSINPTELQQVLVNLIVNAVQAMPEGGPLQIVSRSVRREGSAWVEISVSDSGVGMTAAVLARIFDPFYTTKRGQGTGLGLSISHTLVARAGGDLRATSAPGQGSRFVIALPVRADPA